MDVLIWLRAEWDRVAGFSLIGLGAAAVALGFHGVAGSPFVAEELAYIASGGIGGLFLLGLGVGLLISADLKDEWRKLDEIATYLRHEAEALDDGVVEVVTASSARPSTRGPGRHLAAVAGVALTVGVGVMAFGWHRAGGESDPDAAIRGLGFAVIGLVVAVAAIVLANFWGKRQVMLRSTSLLLPFAAAALTPFRPGPAVPATHPPSRVVVAEGLGRYHRPGCPMLEGLKSREVDIANLPKQLTPCGLCGTP